MTREAFFKWAEAREERYEFDGVRPVPAMSGGLLLHSVIVGNLGAELGTRLRETAFIALGNGAGVSTIGKAVRYPDNVVTRLPIVGTDRMVTDPVVIFEVLSPSSLRIDRVIKRREYQAVASIRRYMIIASAMVEVAVLSRDAGTGAFTGGVLSPHEMLQLPEIGVTIPVAALYAGLSYG